MPVVKVVRPVGSRLAADLAGRGLDVLHARTDRPGEPRLAVLASGLLPRVYGGVPGEPGLYYGEGRTLRELGPRLWEVRCPVFRREAGPPPGPLEERAVILRRDELVEEPVSRWADGRPARTAAGEWIPGIVRRVVRTVYPVTLNLGAEPAWFDALAGKVNAAPVRVRGRTLAARTVQFTPKSWGAWEERQNQRFFVAGFELTHDVRGFRRRIVHRGFKAVDYRVGQVDGDGRPLPPVAYRVEDADGEVEEAVPLDPRGRAWREPDPADPLADPNDDLSRPLARQLTEAQFAATVLEEDVEEAADFGVIPRTFG